MQVRKRLPSDTAGKKPDAAPTDSDPLLRHSQDESSTIGMARVAQKSPSGKVELRRVQEENAEKDKDEPLSQGSTPLLKSGKAKEVIDSTIDLALKVLSMPKGKVSSSNLSPQPRLRDKAFHEQKDEAKRLRNSYSNERLKAQPEPGVNAMKASFDQLPAAIAIHKGKQTVAASVNLFNIKERLDKKEGQNKLGDSQVVERIADKNAWKEDSEELKEFLEIEQSLKSISRPKPLPKDEAKCRNATRFQEYIIKSPHEEEQKVREAFKTASGETKPEEEKKMTPSPPGIDSKSGSEKGKANRRRRECAKSKGRGEKPVNKVGQRNFSHVERSVVTTSPKANPKRSDPAAKKAKDIGAGNSFVENGKIAVTTISLSSSSFDHNTTNTHIGPRTATNAGTRGLGFGDDRVSTNASVKLSNVKELVEDEQNPRPEAIQSARSMETPLMAKASPLLLEIQPKTCHEKSASFACEEGKKLAAAQGLLDSKERVLISVPAPL